MNNNNPYGRAYSAMIGLYPEKGELIEFTVKGYDWERIKLIYEQLIKDVDAIRNGRLEHEKLDSEPRL